MVQFGWLISSIEWLVFVCTHTLGKAWKSSARPSPPMWVQAVMARGQYPSIHSSSSVIPKYALVVPIRPEATLYNIMFSDSQGQIQLVYWGCRCVPNLSPPPQKNFSSYFDKKWNIGIFFKCCPPCRVTLCLSLHPSMNKILDLPLYFYPVVSYTFLLVSLQTGDSMKPEFLYLTLDFLFLHFACRQDFKIIGV